MDALVEIRDVSKHYGSFTAIDNLSLTVNRGEFVVLLGPSGSGKTTLLSMIGGFSIPDSGEVVIAGNTVTNLPPAQRPTATVFQDYALFPHFSVGGNIAFGLSQKKVPKSEQGPAIERVLSAVGLAGYADRRIHELSGGQKQRVALARAMAVEPEVLLLDEPLGALDVKIRRLMQEELLEIQHRIGTTFVHVTHDQEEAMTIADQIVVINKGRVEDMGTPRRIYSRPATRFAATFMGDGNLIDGKIVERHGDDIKVDTPLGPLVAKADHPVGARINMLVRPEKLKIAEPGASNVIGRVRVEEIVYQGTCLRVRMMADRAEEKRLLLVISPETPIETGDMITLEVEKKDLVVLED